MIIPRPPVWQCIPTVVRLSALIFLYIHHLKRIFLSGHPDSLLYIHFCRTHTLYLSFISITNQMDPHISFLLIFPSLPILPPHAVSLSLHPLPFLRPCSYAGEWLPAARGARPRAPAVRGARPRPPAGHAELSRGPRRRARRLAAALGGAYAGSVSV